MPDSGYLDICGGDAFPLELVADLPKAGQRRRVAEGALEPGRVEVARLEPERAGGGVVLGQVGAEHRRVVGGDRAECARADQLWQRVLGEIADDTRSQIREGTDVEHDPAVDDLLEKPRVLDGANAVAHPLRAERLERAANRLRSGGLPSVRNGCQARCPRF